MGEQLYNKKSKDDLVKDLHSEDFVRLTISFYKYMVIDNPEDLRDQMYRDFSSMRIFGRVYIAKEGVNVQISIPEYHKDDFIKYMNKSNKLSQLNQLIYRSNLLGSDLSITNFGGGNTSSKIIVKDPITKRKEKISLLSLSA